MIGFGPDGGGATGACRETTSESAGEAIAHIVITELCGRDEPYFRTWFLDSKFPTFDYIVFLVDHPAYYFFVQVKATTLGCTIGPRRVFRSKSPKTTSTVWSPAPRKFVLGIDMNTSDGYWLSVNEVRDHVASLTTAFPSACQTPPIFTTRY